MSVPQTNVGFILWMIAADRQRVVFVEPHGMLHAKAYEVDEKAQLHERLPGLAEGIARRSGVGGQVSLDSYIVSATSHAELKPKYGDGKWEPEDFARRHILFSGRRGAVHRASVGGGRLTVWADPIMRSIVALDGFDKRYREYKRLGWVYVARNPCFAEPVFKIGQTKVSPVMRVEGLSSSTSVYRSFELVYFVHVSDRDRAEGHVHQALAESRVNPSKEFFLAPIMTVVRALDESANHWPIQLGRTPRAGFLGPALMPRVVACQHCGGRTKVPRLLVSVQVNCGHCSGGFEVASDVRG